MSASEEEIDRIAENLLELTSEDIDTATDAAEALGLGLTADVETVEDRATELTLRVHPDAGGNADAFIALQEAEQKLLEFEGEDEAEAQAEEVRESGAPGSPGTGGWGPDEEQKQEVYRETVEDVKIFFASNLLDKDIRADTFAEARQNQEVTNRDLQIIEEALRQTYGVPDLTLDDIARVLASLIVTGSIRMGSVERMAERSGVFGGSGMGAFSRGGRRGGEGFSSFRR